MRHKRHYVTDVNITYCDDEGQEWTGVAEASWVPEDPDTGYGDEWEIDPPAVLDNEDGKQTLAWSEIPRAERAILIERACIDVADQFTDDYNEN